MTIDRDDDEVRLGYKNPPPWSQFQKGRSGNPKGRPKKKPTPTSKTPNDSAADDVLREEINRKIRVNDANGSSEVSILEVVHRALANAAAKGNVSAQREFLQQVHALEERDAARKATDNEQRQKMFNAFTDWRTSQIEHWTAAEPEGTEPAEPWPHPDDMHLNETQWEWHIHGPSCEDELPLYEYLRAERDKMFVQAELKRREDDAPDSSFFSLRNACWLTYDLLMPKRWQVQDNDDAWSHLATSTSKRLQAELEQHAERAEQLKKRAKLPPRNKDEYRFINETLKPVLKASGYHSLAQLESIHESDGFGQN